MWLGIVLIGLVDDLPERLLDDLLRRAVHGHLVDAMAGDPGS